MAESTTITLSDVELFKANALHWAAQFRVCCLLVSNGAHEAYHKREYWTLAVDTVRELRAGSKTEQTADSAGEFLLSASGNDEHVGNDSFERLRSFQAASSTAVFGFFGYDLKNEIENLESNHPDAIGFPDMYFFEPRYLFQIEENKLTVNRNYPETFELLEAIVNTQGASPDDSSKGSEVYEDGFTMRSRTAHSEYVSNVSSIREQIEMGDFYELNYCNEFYAEGCVIHPVETFHRLNNALLAPFSCFVKLSDKFLLCASPERFLKKQGRHLMSQPMKGTIRKGATEEEDILLREALKNDPKERAENVMIVDLVRNDLARSSVPGSVKVQELFGVYPFTSVNQMISTITSTLADDSDGVTAIRHAFPMGSMTGAPKVEVMKNIEHYENFKRGLYSGAVGYITPEDDFDFNVVIRSILYNQTTKYISVRVGGAITYDSVPEKEWQELLLKAASIFEVLGTKLEPNMIVPDYKS